MQLVEKFGIASLLVLQACVVACTPEPLGRGEIQGSAASRERVVEHEQARGDAAERVAQRAGLSAPQKQILFGDLHVHTTFSPDAFAIGLPLMGGEGARPPALACDYARHCSQLDFWSINDHAEGITPRRWRETIESIRECNAVAGSSEDPDLVSFLGWEWSQVAWEPENHYGHKNVILLETDPEQVPRRPIAAPRERLGSAAVGRPTQLLLSLLDFENRDYYLGFQSYYDEIAETPICESGIDTRQLPDECLELAAEPRDLFEKLEQWGGESIVIPHGNAWGLNTPPGTSFAKQLTAEQHDPSRQTLIEVYSGHGNSEEYRDWRAVVPDAQGVAQCPAPRDDFYPCCWRAGELIRERCEEAGESAATCASRETEARRNYVDASVTGYWTVPGTTVEDWLDCGQCKDCFLPTFDHRPGTSTQYALALSRPGESDGDEDLRFRFGLIGSSDVHRARAGTGYKEFARTLTTEANQPKSERLGRAFVDEREPAAESFRFENGVTPLGLNKSRHMERQASFYLTGGLVAAHSSGRDRDSVWSAFQRKEVYATSGDRILLWFDHLGTDLSTGAERVRPMGSAFESSQTPRFRVRAVGSFEQKPGCPADSIRALGQAGVDDVCLGECYHPSDKRRRIERIEVVRIRPQLNADEEIADLIDDSFLSFDCPEDPAGCVVEFEDPEFAASKRDALYYVRAIQEATPVINGGNLRCERDAEGRCVTPKPCHANYGVAGDDDCLWPAEERAWSSPIFVDHADKAGRATGRGAFAALREAREASPASLAGRR